MEELKDLAKELGTPGFQKLYKAARKRNIDISKTEVKSFLAKQGQKQIFKAKQPQRNHFIEFRWI